ncbi:CpsB/CapC family capsule biosynthesis tyrosine phosphatase [Bacillus sp. E(2018)]|uniref:tyrosine-protein phosphatase n=1 Tax=Bacillus sp. E(2018) TaxID=2502239 RepID=UPI0010F57726|nr:CpsB/CapC family capsule biosynthesis tyrosine phosphatase [Bacillus sp. E(2018)]
MIDIHSHILPGIDDGAATLDDALRMAEAAVKEGITHLYATPHHRNGRFENEKQPILHHVNIFNEELTRRDISLQILPGQEIRLYKELIEDLERGDIIPLNQQSKHLLIEFPSSNVPAYAAETIYELIIRNYTPIIVHPERNSEIMENPDLLYDLIIEGALTQITANSVVGNFGKKIMNFSHDLIKANMTHFVASDAHNVSSRGFHLNEAFETIQKQHGVEKRFYLQENAQLVLRGESILNEPPSHIRKKKFLGIF